MVSMSTVKPPLTLSLMMPVTLWPASQAFSSSSQAFARFALSRDRRVSPLPSSTVSSATSTSSPTAISSSPFALRNCSTGTTPSDFSPALMMTKSGRISTMRPLTMVPGRILAAIWLLSNSSAKLSDIFT